MSGAITGLVHIPVGMFKLLNPLNKAGYNSLAKWKIFKAIRYVVSQKKESCVTQTVSITI